MEFTYNRGTLVPVTHADPSQTSLNPTEDVLERPLRALKGRVSRELESMFTATRDSTVEFLFEDMEQQQDVSESFLFEDQQHQEEVNKFAKLQRAFVVSLRSRVAEIFPELHERGIMSVKFRTWDGLSEMLYDWVEDSKVNFAGIPYTQFRAFGSD